MNENGLLYVARLILAHCARKFLENPELETQLDGDTLNVRRKKVPPGIGLYIEIRKGDKPCLEIGEVISKGNRCEEMTISIESALKLYGMETIIPHVFSRIEKIAQNKLK